MIFQTSKYYNRFHLTQIEFSRRQSMYTYHKCPFQLENCARPMTIMYILYIVALTTILPRTFACMVYGSICGVIGAGRRSLLTVYLPPAVHRMTSRSSLKSNGHFNYTFFTHNHMIDKKLLRYRTSLLAIYKTRSKYAPYWYQCRGHMQLANSD